MDGTVRMTWPVEGNRIPVRVGDCPADIVSPLAALLPTRPDIWGDQAAGSAGSHLRLAIRDPDRLRARFAELGGIDLQGNPAGFWGLPETIAAYDWLRAKLPADADLFSFRLCRTFAGSTNPSHVDFTKRLGERLAIILPIVDPPGALFEIGQRRFDLEPGQAIAFDPGQEHAVFNSTATDRFTLMMIWWVSARAS